MTIERTRVVIAGGTGFVGRELAAALATSHDVVVLGRTPPSTELPAGVVFRRCDLYDAEGTREALRGASVAVYLVHSMLPAARLVQASFTDLDAICADNFARAAAHAGIARIVYLGGLTPPHPSHLSEHLRSRQEVERILASHGAAVVSLRAGMVIGAGGSSFRIMLRLVERLPWMVIPRWGASKSQPIGLRDVARLLAFVVEHPETPAGAYDVASPSVLSYRQMLEHTARLLGRAPRIYTLPFHVPWISLLWVSAITGAPLDLVMPLVESLKHDMVAQRGLELQAAAGTPLATFDELVAEAIAHEHRAAGTTAPHAREASRPRAMPRPPRRALSLQRFRNPRGLSASAIADEYFRWLPHAMRPFVRVRPLSTSGCSFHLVGWSRPLLELVRDEAASEPGRTIDRIAGGALVAPSGHGHGSLEFRHLLGGSEVTALVSGFEPRLPWPVYQATQAVAHLVIMRAFGRHLSRMG